MTAPGTHFFRSCRLERESDLVAGAKQNETDHTLRWSRGESGTANQMFLTAMSAGFVRTHAFVDACLQDLVPANCLRDIVVFRRAAR